MSKELNNEFTLSLAVSQACETPDWATAKRFTEAANRMQHGAVACRVMAGLVLSQLHHEHGITPGRPVTDKFRHDDGIKSWEELVEQKLGVSEPTARRWMNMAEAALPRLKNGTVASLFRQLLDMPISTWSTSQTQQIAEAMEKLVNGRSQLDFMKELGLLADPAAKGGDKEWEAFLKAKHPELIKNGKCPPRGKAGKDSKAIMAEFQKWAQARTRPRSEEQRREAARVALKVLEEHLSAAISDANMGLLAPQDFVAVEAITKTWADRLKHLRTRKD